MTFVDSLFPQSLSFGSRGGPERSVRISRTPSGFEQRQSLRADSLRVYDAEYGIQVVDLQSVINFFEAMDAQLDTFPFFDHLDYNSASANGDISATDQSLGFGDTAATVDFQLVKNYTVGANTYARPIVLPVLSTLLVALDGSPTTGFSCTRPGGVVTLDSDPGVGVEVTAGFEYHVLARFDMDMLQGALDNFKLGSIDGLQIREVPYVA